MPAVPLIAFGRMPRASELATLPLLYFALVARTAWRYRVSGSTNDDRLCRLSAGRLRIAGCLRIAGRLVAPSPGLELPSLEF